MNDGKTYQGPQRRPLPAPCGRPTKLTDEMLDQVRGFDGEGTDDKIIMERLDIGRTTLWRARQAIKNVPKPGPAVGQGVLEHQDGCENGEAGQ